MDTVVLTLEERGTSAPRVEFSLEHGGKEERVGIKGMERKGKTRGGGGASKRGVDTVTLTLQEKGTSAQLFEVSAKPRYIGTDTYAYARINRHHSVSLLPFSTQAIVTNYPLRG